MLENIEGTIKNGQYRETGNIGYTVLSKIVNYTVILRPITEKMRGGRSNPTLGEVYSIQHYVIKFVSDLLQVCGFLRILHQYN